MLKIFLYWLRDISVIINKNQVLSQRDSFDKGIFRKFTALLQIHFIFSF
ncbi:hypothetical protein YN1HA_25660 [Sulfurisphaera ohwakuensis]